MNHLTSYQHAHDAAGEQAADREDAVTAAGERIAADPTKLREAIEGMLVDTEVDVPELLALLYRSNLFAAAERESAHLDRFINPRLLEVIRNTNTAINAAIDEAAEYEILMAEAERDRERLNRDWED